jgi:hypothetical protein
MLNALIACVCSIVLTIAVLQSNLTPYRIVSKAELQYTANEQAMTASAPRHGDWMFDPTHKTSLDKPETTTKRVVMYPR